MSEMTDKLREHAAQLEARSKDYWAQGRLGRADEDSVLARMIRVVADDSDRLRSGSMLERVARLEERVYDLECAAAKRPSNTAKVIVRDACGLEREMHIEPSFVLLRRRLRLPVRLNPTISYKPGSQPVERWDETYREFEFRGRYSSEVPVLEEVL